MKMDRKTQVQFGGLRFFIALFLYFVFVFCYTSIYSFVFIFLIWRDYQ